VCKPNNTYNTLDCGVNRIINTSEPERILISVILGEAKDIFDLEEFYQ